MDFLAHIDVLILAFNEEPNIARTLSALTRFPRVLVLDSGSTDGTVAIVQSFANARVAHRPFDSHAEQWNHGLAQCGLDAPWVLALDADYRLTPQLVDEIAALRPPGDVSGCRCAFRYCIDGEPLSGSLYPPVTVLYRRDGAQYLQDGHTQRIQVKGGIAMLRHSMLHDDRKPFSAWLQSQDRYARLECELLLRTPWNELRWRDRLRCWIWITPWLVPLYCLVAKRGLLDGRRGLFYALQRGLAETLLSLRLLQAAWTTKK